MALMAAHGQITPMPAFGIFCDTQDEPQSVYRWLDWLEERLPFPVVRVSKGKLSDDAVQVHARKDGNGFWVRNLIPAFVLNLNNSIGITKRQCTYNYKVELILKHVRQLASIKRGQTSIGVVQWIGISLDEVHRMKPSSVKWSEHRWPLIDIRMNRHDCLLWMQDHDYPEPPRSACVYCPYHSNTEWRRLKEREPESFAKAVRFERDYQTARAIAERSGGRTISPPFLCPSRSSGLLNRRRSRAAGHVWERVRRDVWGLGMKFAIALLFLLVGTAFGDSRVFIFRPKEVTSKQIGTVNVTRSIVIKYGLELRPNSRSRFIALDSQSVHLKPILKTSEGNAVGFVIVTLDQPVLDVVITPKFMAKLRVSVNLSAKQVMSREANLGVEFSRVNGKLKITRVTLN